MFRAPSIACVLLAAALTACGDAPMNSGANVVVRVINATGADSWAVTLRDAGGGTSTWTFSEGVTDPGGLGTGVTTGGEPVHLHVEIGDETADHTCHVHPDAVGNPDLVPTAVILGEPLRVVCRSGWLEEEADGTLRS